MRTPILTTLALLLLALPLAAQTYWVGVSLGASTVSTKVSDFDHNLDIQEVMAGWFIEEDTILNLRYQKLEPGSDTGAVSPDLKMVAVTVDYLFSESIFTTGFFLGPAYFDGDAAWAEPLVSTPTVEKDDFIGLVGGIETFIPLTRKMDLTFQLISHYLPFERESYFTYGVTGGLTFKF